VRATHGEVMVWRMEPIEAYFHSSCGGQTESGAEALGRPKPYLQPVACGCGELARNSWTRKLPGSAFGALAKDLEDVRVLERTATGRARKVELVTAKGRRVVTGVELRRVVGYDKIRSLHFEPGRQAGAFTFTGRGFGHGAGMCQWGAKGYADQGWDYRRILAHYYPGAELRRMY
jgi:stage II sporulation protein D